MEIKYFKDLDGKVRAIEPGQEFLIQKDWKEMTAEQVDLHLHPTKTIENLFNAKQNEIINKFKSAMSSVTSLYTAEEVASFPTQEPEALAWKADNTAATPLIDGILQQRTSVDKPTLVQRIIDNAANYKLVAGPAIGKKQHFEDLLFSLRTQHDDPEQPDITKPDIDSIVVDYS